MNATAGIGAPTTIETSAVKHRSALRRPLVMLEAGLRRTVARFLDHEIAEYELTVHNDMATWYRHLRKGDVVLVEGRLRISQLIKYATQSQWSHSALYVGDELLRRGGRLREQALANFGEFADRLLVEALSDEGVVVAPLEKYRRHNLRLCRPHRIDAADLELVIGSVVDDLGKRYDNRNLLDLAVSLLAPVKFGPLRTRTIATCLGNGTDLEVIKVDLSGDGLMNLQPVSEWAKRGGGIGHTP